MSWPILKGGRARITGMSDMLFKHKLKLTYLSKGTKHRSKIKYSKIYITQIFK
jgi:hypothetical protein